MSVEPAVVGDSVADPSSLPPPPPVQQTGATTTAKSLDVLIRNGFSESSVRPSVPVVDLAPNMIGTATGSEDTRPAKKLKSSASPSSAAGASPEGDEGGQPMEGETLTYRVVSSIGISGDEDTKVSDAPLAPLANYRSLVSGVSELLPPEEGRKRTMLVVDDSHTVRCFLQRTFEMQGFQVDIATDGWQAISQMQSHMYDIVFMDLEMPVMNGYRCAQAIRTWERNVNRDRRQYICALTSHNQTHEQQLCMKVGMDQFEAKPVKVRRLIEIVKDRGSGGEDPEQAGAAEGAAAAEPAATAAAAATSVAAAPTASAAAAAGSSADMVADDS